jgi:hypothetical protein
MHDLSGQGAAEAQIYTAIDSRHAAASNRPVNAIPVLKDISNFQLCHGI